MRYPRPLAGRTKKEGFVVEGLLEEPGATAGEAALLRMGSYLEQGYVQRPSPGGPPPTSRGASQERPSRAIFPPHSISRLVPTPGALEVLIGTAVHRVDVIPYQVLEHDGFDSLLGALPRNQACLGTGWSGSVQRSGPGWAEMQTALPSNASLLVGGHIQGIDTEHVIRAVSGTKMYFSDGLTLPINSDYGVAYGFWDQRVEAHRMLQEEISKRVVNMDVILDSDQAGILIESFPAFFEYTLRSAWGTDINSDPLLNHLLNRAIGEINKHIPRSIMGDKTYTISI